MTSYAEIVEHDVCALPLVRRVAALMDMDPLRIKEGDPLPRGWQFILFTPISRHSTLRADGFEPAPAELAELTGFRMMFGGRRAQFLADIPVGARVRRISQIKSIVRKAGQQGPLTIVTTEYRTYPEGATEPAIVESQDMIYRGPSPAGASGVAAKPKAADVSADLTKRLKPSESMLFRFSAITFNSHRIHYDGPYAANAEGYPALVVNAGFTTLLLLELFREFDKAELRTLRTRNIRPLFCGRELALNAARTGDSCRLWVTDHEGFVAVECDINAGVNSGG